MFTNYPFAKCVWRICVSIVYTIADILLSWTYICNVRIHIFHIYNRSFRKYMYKNDLTPNFCYVYFGYIHGVSQNEPGNILGVITVRPSNKKEYTLFFFYRNNSFTFCWTDKTEWNEKKKLQRSFKRTSEHMERMK